MEDVRMASTARTPFHPWTASLPYRIIMICITDPIQFKIARIRRITTFMNSLFGPYPYSCCTTKYTMLDVYAMCTPRM